MTTIKRTNILILISTLLIPLTTLSMEKNYPQLQLQEPKKEKLIIHGTLSISAELNRAVYPLGTMTWVESSSLIPLGEPYIAVEIIDNSNNKKHPVVVPVKKLYNCDDKSYLTFTNFDPFKEVHVTCHKNPTIDETTFKEQFTNYINKFYATPGYSTYQDTLQKLIDAGIITKQLMYVMRYFPTDAIEGLTHIPFMHTEAVYAHGPNGCPSEERLIEIMVAPHVQPYNNSMFQFITARQYGNKNHCKKLQPTTPEETQALFERYKQLESLEQLLEHKLTLEQK
jgi:hypothetical protein